MNASITSERRNQDSGRCTSAIGLPACSWAAPCRIFHPRYIPAALPPILPCPRSKPTMRSRIQSKSAVPRKRLATPMNSSWSLMKWRVRVTRIPVVCAGARVSSPRGSPAKRRTDAERDVGKGGEALETLGLLAPAQGVHDVLHLLGRHDGRRALEDDGLERQ